jgi:16S rRNA (cytosine1402-N4)-methyltransferase
MTDTKKPKRRPRYRGTHPRHFAEKYKEHAPERYVDDFGKVLARGQTPAGSHRPIMVDEILTVLRPKPGDLAVDCTLGHGGHASRLLSAIRPGGQLIAFDVDPIESQKTEARLHELGFGECCVVHRKNFAGLSRLLPEPADLILADLGVSSMQLDNPERGFTFKHDGPLDLRMNPRRGRPARALLATLGPNALSTVLRENADIPNAERLAEGILLSPPSTTMQLAEAVRRSGGDEDAVRLVFQALRIEINDEFGALDALLRDLPLCMKPGGRVAILTFHSGEDRRVKKAFQSGEREGIYSAIAHDIIRAGPDEIRDNPRSRSAKLRWAQRA